jgi:outer membrane protein assembly factor BamB
MTLFRLLLIVCFLPSLTNCSGEFLGEKETGIRLEGERISINALERDLTADDSVKSIDVTLPYPIENISWLQPGGNSIHAMQHLALADIPAKIWSASSGDGSTHDAIVLASPLVQDYRVMTLGREGNLRTLNVSDGSLIWQQRLQSKDQDMVYSGAIAANLESIFVALGSGELICVRILDGKEVWRTSTKNPLRGGPTVSGGRVFVVTIDNKTLSFDAKTGKLLWSHAGTMETAALIGGASPAVKDNVVIVTYSSGEVFALKTETGRVFWADHLGPNNRFNGVSNIADINGAPVIDRSLVLSISNSGRLTAIDFKTGRRVWERSVAGANTPWVAGDFIFVISNDGEVICITRNSGLIKWVKQMPQFESSDDKEGIIRYAGPVLAGDRLLVVSSLGEIYSLSPYKGTILGKANVPASIFISPVVAGKMLFILDNEGTLTAFR